MKKALAVCIGIMAASSLLVAGPAGAAPNRTPDAYYDVNGDHSWDKGTDVAVRLRQLAPGVLYFNETATDRAAGSELVIENIRARSYAAVIVKGADVRLNHSAGVGDGVLSMHAIDGDLTIAEGALMRVGGGGLTLGGDNVVIEDDVKIQVNANMMRVDGETITIGKDVMIQMNSDRPASPDYKTGHISIIATKQVSIDESAKIGGRYATVMVRP